MDGVSGPGVGLETTVTHGAVVGMPALVTAGLICDAGAGVPLQAASKRQRKIIDVLREFFEYGMLGLVNCLL